MSALHILQEAIGDCCDLLAAIGGGCAQGLHRSARLFVINLLSEVLGRP